MAAIAADRSFLSKALGRRPTGGLHHVRSLLGWRKANVYKVEDFYIALNEHQGRRCTCLRSARQWQPEAMHRSTVHGHGAAPRYLIDV